MKGIISFIFLIIIFGAGYFYRDKIREVLRPQSIIAPVTKDPIVIGLTSLLEKNDIAISSPPILIDGAIQASISGITVIFAADKDLFSQVRSLQLVLSKLKMEQNPFREIDLRFNKVVIR